MEKSSLKVGVTAIFDPRITPHARTFLRALAWARNFEPGLAGIEFVFADDGADAQVAKSVANRFLRAGVDLVIGHFSSDAAVAAMEVYEKAGIPLLTPAATADALVAEHPLAFRLCPADGRLADRLLELVKEKGWARLQLESDDSYHGRSVAAAVRDKGIGSSIQFTASSAQAVVFCGRLGASQRFVDERIGRREAAPIILTDDAVSPRFKLGEAEIAPVLAVGFRPPNHHRDAARVVRQYRLLFGSEPETYFLESCAAFQIAAQLAATRSPRSIAVRLGSEVFATVLGPVSFEDGELPTQTHAVWELGPQGFEVHTDATWSI